MSDFYSFTGIVPSFSFAASNKSWYVQSFDYSQFLTNIDWGNAVFPDYTLPQTGLFPISWTKNFDFWHVEQSPLKVPQSLLIPSANTAVAMQSSEEWSSRSTVAKFHVPEPMDTAAAVEVIAEWDGYVEAIYSDYFVGNMQGLRGVGVAGKEEDAEIPISDVDLEDRDLLVEGGFFRLMIAYESPRVGPRKRYTTVQFRRLPAYTKRELDAADREADELIDGFHLEESSKSAGT